MPQSDEASLLPHAIDRAAPIIAILAFAIMTAASLESLWSPTAPGGGPASFSAERAMAHVEALAARPRPAGSAAHRGAREYIVTALRGSAGLGAETRGAAATSTRYGVRLWQALGSRIVGTVPEAFEHPTLGRVGRHIMHRFL